MRQSHFDASRHKWREVTGEPGLSYFVHHDYTILGYDLEAGTLDMVVRWGRDGGHCPLHRHVATTTVLVLEGEQHLCSLNADGSRAEPIVRKAGDYALSVGRALPHFESGGADGGMAFLGCHSTDRRLYELLDEDQNLLIDVTMELLIEDWKANTGS
ncbi:MAG: hypothetical protein JRH10_08585 [Deltaproteobacteria bacterium]|nr:hypothetical protein [Deltaproteobacteria bacterium]